MRTFVLQPTGEETPPPIVKKSVKKTKDSKWEKKK